MLKALAEEVVGASAVPPPKNETVSSTVDRGHPMRRWRQGRDCVGQQYSYGAVSSWTTLESITLATNRFQYRSSWRR